MITEKITKKLKGHTHKEFPFNMYVKIVDMNRQFPTKIIIWYIQVQNHEWTNFCPTVTQGASKAMSLDQIYQY